MWEDEANKFGGKWIVRLRKGGALKFGLFTILFKLWAFHSSFARSEFPVLGELGAGHARRAVHGRGGDLRRCCLHQVPGGHPQVKSFH